MPANTSMLVTRNVTITGRREGMTRHELCATINRRRRASTLTAAVRVFVVGYYQTAATEDGHASVGHGVLLRPRSRLGHS